jgi:hypothetical protein
MRTRARSVIGCLAMAWIVLVVAWAAYGSMTHRIRAGDVSRSRWRRAIERPATLPIRWTPGNQAAPLLPAQGQIVERDGETVIDGLALVPGTFRLERLRFAVAFSLSEFHRYPKLGRPLVPFLPGAKEDRVPPAQAVDICCGISDPAGAESEGLRVRWDSSLGVFRTGSTIPLFPPREGRLQPGPRGWCELAVEIDGDHVLAYANDQLLLDFRTRRALVGGVGLGTHEGVVFLKKLEVIPLQ